MLPLPPLETLACFDAAARTLNFRSAARAVALSPAAFGQRIKQLEEHLGAVLFERTTRSVRLTAAGTSLLPRARNCLAAAEQCLRHAEGPFPRIELTLGTRFELGMSWVVPELGRLKLRHPELTLHLYFGAGRDLLERVKSNDIDCAVTSARLGDTLAAEVLHEEEYVFVGAPALLRRNPFSLPEHAARHVLLDIDASMPLFRYLSEHWTGRGRFEFGSHHFLGLGSAIKELAIAGQGVAVLPRYMVQSELRARKLRRLLPKASLSSDHFRLVFRRDDPRAELFRSIAGTLRAVPIR
jgi:DNA-binding transcriptional LysR family regulator